MRKAIIILSIITFYSNAFSQESADTLWKFGGVTALNFSQMQLSNWAAGGDNSLTTNAIVNLTADYKSISGKASWNNELLFGYGVTRLDAENYRKNDDKIDIASKFGYSASKNWNYTGLLSFKTQFTKGYANPGDENRIKISNLMAPGYLNLSFGMDFIPNDNFTLFLSPLTGKMTFVLDDELSADGSFGVEPGQTTRTEFGGYIKIAYSKEILKNVKLNTKIDLFSNYIENPEYVDVNFDLLLSFKINKFLSASFISTMIYDYDIKFDILDANGVATGETEARIQWKEIFGIGLTYSF